MESAVTKKGQTNIPAAIRKRYKGHKGQQAHQRHEDGCCGRSLWHL